MGYLIQFIFARLLRARPRIHKLGNLLIAQTSWPFGIITLGLKLRKIKISPQYGKIQIDDRFCWIFTKSRTIPFSQVYSVVYQYNDVNPIGGMPGTATQEWDQFVISLRLKNGKDVRLCKFFGTGGLQNNTIAPDWMLWDEQIMARITAGNQEDESRLFVETLTGMMHVELENQ